MDRRVIWIVQLLEHRWHAHVRLSELARIVGLGESRLQHLFKQETRISIREYIRERRLREAARMLEQTEERISVISFRVGFQHVANFNHAFKKSFGVSPREYRNSRTDQVNAENANLF